MLSGNFAEMTTSTPFRDILRAANLRHGTDDFTSPPKEGVLRVIIIITIIIINPENVPSNIRLLFVSLQNIKLSSHVYHTCAVI